MKIYGNVGSAGTYGEGVPLPTTPQPIRERTKPSSGVVWPEWEDDEPVFDEPKKKGAKRGPKVGTTTEDRADRNARIVADAQADPNLTHSDLAAKYELSQFSIRNILHQAGIKRQFRADRKTYEGPKKCAWCGETFDKRPEDRMDAWNKRMTCSRVCAAKYSSHKRYSASQGDNVSHDDAHEGA